MYKKRDEVNRGKACEATGHMAHGTGGDTQCPPPPSKNMVYLWPSARGRGKVRDRQWGRRHCLQTNP